MDTITKRRFNALYEAFIAPVMQVYDIFKDFYTEDRVDLQGIPSYDLFYDTISVCNFTSVFPHQKTKYKNVDTIPDTMIKNISSASVIINQGIKLMLEGDYKSKWDYIASKFATPRILVHFPEVTVTNEIDQRIVVKDLYVKVEVLFNGTISGTFGINRATYPSLHWTSDYMHSHVPGINYSEPTHFLGPCLGSGPIRDTIASLNHECDYDLWGLFCLELDKYVQVESLEGVPYRRMANVTHRRETTFWGGMEFNYQNQLSSNHISWMLKFSMHVIHNQLLPINFTNNSFVPGCSWDDCVILISNAFIEWYNSLEEIPTALGDMNIMIDSSVLRPGRKQGSSWTMEYTRRVSRLEHTNTGDNALICYFKGESIYRKIIADTSEESRLQNQNTIYLLHPNIISAIIDKILFIINLTFSDNGNIANAPFSQKICCI